MDRETKREVVTALVKAGRRDLAEQFVRAKPTVVTAGYTHYWRPPGKPAFSDDQWKKLVAGVKKIVAAARKKGIQIAGPLGTGKVQYKSDMIALNGQEPDYGESFVLKRDLEDFGFCKTGERPYDDVVVSILALARKLAPELVFLSSDGGDGIFNNPPFKA